MLGLLILEDDREGAALCERLLVEEGRELEVLGRLLREPLVRDDLDCAQSSIAGAATRIKNRNPAITGVLRRDCLEIIMMTTPSQNTDLNE